MSVVTVAVGVMTDTGGRVLVTRRPIDTYHGGLWEFPGGKQESCEEIMRTLSRELNEEQVEVLAGQSVFEEAFLVGGQALFCAYLTCDACNGAHRRHTREEGCRLATLGPF